MIELKNQTAEAVKSVKSAWNALNNINIQVRMLQQELENNINVVSQMQYHLQEIKKGNTEIDIPSTYFYSLLGQFESRLSLYKKRIDEMEDIINSSLEKENQKQRFVQEGSAAVDDPMGYDDSQGISSNSSLLYQVLHLLYSNFWAVANQVEALNEIVESKEKKMIAFLNKNSSLSQNEIEKLFEYKESESESLMKSSDWSTLMAFDKFSLDEKKEDDRRLGKKRKAYDTLLIRGEDERAYDYSPIEGNKRSRVREGDYGYSPIRSDSKNRLLNILGYTDFQSSRRNDLRFRGISSDRKFY